MTPRRPWGPTSASLGGGGRLTWAPPRVSSTGRRGTVRQRSPGEGGPGRARSVGSAGGNVPLAF